MEGELGPSQCGPSIRAGERCHFLPLGTQIREELTRSLLMTQWDRSLMDIHVCLRSLPQWLTFCVSMCEYAETSRGSQAWCHHRDDLPQKTGLGPSCVERRSLQSVCKAGMFSSMCLMVRQGEVCGCLLQGSRVFTCTTAVTMPLSSDRGYASPCPAPPSFSLGIK